jgi:hypothetical protein
MAASGLKWMSATMGTGQPAARRPATMGRGWRRRLDARSGGGDADDFAAGGDEVERLLDAGRRCPGVAGDHRLHPDRVVAADVNQMA